MIEAHGLVKHYGTVEAIRGVSFSVRTGEVVGLLGPNGAGKTTIMKILTCYHRPTAGTAVVDFHDVSTDTMGVRRTVGYLPENAPVYQDLKVSEYLDFVADVRGFSRKERAPRVERAMTLCGLTSMAFRTIDKLSKGYRQRVGLAQAIIHDPDTLILDEPTSGLDPNQIVEIRNLVTNLGRQKTVILSTHVLQEVEALCRSVIILNHGLVVADGTSSDIAGAISGRKTVVSITLEGATQTEVAAATTAMVSDASPGAPISIGGNRTMLEIALNSGTSESVVSDWAIVHGFRIVAMTNKSLDLEDIFRTLTRPGGENA